jgi:hypothetical protein
VLLEVLEMVHQVQTEAMAVILFLTQQQQQVAGVALHMTKMPTAVVLVVA